MSENSEETKNSFSSQLGVCIANGLQSVDGVLKIIFSEEVTPLPLHEETPINLSGILDTPARWLEARGIALVDGLKAYVIIDREALKIELVTEERNHFKNRLTGSLTYHPAFVKFGINSEKYISPAAMADKIKMNRAFFENKQVAMNLVTQLKDFKATIQHQLEKKNDNRGNVNELRQQVVSSNLPESFKMKIPIFKGEKPQLLEVEVYIESENLTCCLISPEANEEMEYLRDTAIDEVIKRIKAAIPTIVVIEK